MAEYYHIAYEPGIENCSFEFYDQSRDSMFVVSWMDLMRASLLSTSELHAFGTYETLVRAGGAPPAMPAFAMANSDLFILRPCIEHHMLGVIFGRGGTQELGATFWGQTELSCYDDAQHGIWGMSYKYHERAVVTNERNLCRVFDVAFDGYTGGMGQQKLDWTAAHDGRNSTDALKQAVENRTDPFDGPDMIVMSLLADRTKGEWPNPLVWQNTKQVICDPESGRCVAPMENNTLEYHLEDGANGANRLKDYIQKMAINSWCQYDPSNQSGGAAAVANESTQPCMAFHGSVRRLGSAVPGGPVLASSDTRGSGHLGHSYVGCASIREGRGVVHAVGPAARMHLSSVFQ